jgi:transposase-like protein
MKQVPRQKYTLEFRLEVVRLVNGGVAQAEAARLGRQREHAVELVQGRA